MTLQIRKLTQLAYLDAATDLMLAIRSEDPHAGVNEAADVQWWWKNGGYDNPNNQIFWVGANKKPIAMFLLSKFRDQWYCDCEWLPSAREAAQREIWPFVLRTVQDLPTNKSVEFSIHEGDQSWRQYLESFGWGYTGHYYIQFVFEANEPPPSPLLPAGFEFFDQTTPATDKPHHLTKRNGPFVADRLNECSLYRQDLDLAIRSDSGDVVAYCLCWLDGHNSVGLFEPVRTEDNYQRRGLGRALMVEGIRRLVTLGASLIKVSAEGENTAAQALYRSAGFQPAFRKLTYRFTPSNSIVS